YAVHGGRITSRTHHPSQAAQGIGRQASYEEVRSKISKKSRSFARPTLKRRFLRSANLMVGQPLALRALDGTFGAHGIIDPEPHAVALPKIELCQITVKMLFAAMLVGAHHAAFEDRKDAL